MPWQDLQWNGKGGDNFCIWIHWEAVIKIVIRSLSHCQNVQFNYKSWMYNKYVCVALCPYSFPCTKISFGYSTSFSQAVNFKARRTSWLQDEAMPEWILAWQSRREGGALGHWARLQLRLQPHSGKGSWLSSASWLSLALSGNRVLRNVVRSSSSLASGKPHTSSWLWTCPSETAFSFTDTIVVTLASSFT